MNKDFKKSYFVSDAEVVPELYQELIKRVEPLASDYAFRQSWSRVPHLLVELSNEVVYSICHFKRSRSWRVFWPYPSGNQQKKNFSSIDGVIGFLETESLTREQGGYQMSVGEEVSK